MSVFKAYDVRGVYGNGLDEDLAYKVGNYLPQLLNSDHVNRKRCSYIFTLSV